MKKLFFLLTLLALTSPAIADFHGTIIKTIAHSDKKGSTYSEQFTVPESGGTLLFRVSIPSASGEALVRVGYGSHAPESTGNEVNLGNSGQYTIANAPQGVWTIAIDGKTAYKNFFVEIRTIPANDPLIYDDQSGDRLLNVAEFTQYDPRWGSDPYDHYLGKNMSGKGCATTVLTMLVNYQLEISGISFYQTPGTVNTELSALPDGDGYSGKGAVFWLPAIKYLSNSALTFDYVKKSSASKADEADQYLLDSLAANHPVIVQVKPIPNDPSSTHFVLVIGRDKGRFVINDPGYNMKYLDKFKSGYWTRGTAKLVPTQTLKRLFSKAVTSAKPLVDGIYISSSDAVLFGITGSLKRVTGVTFDGKSIVDGLPNSGTFFDGYDDIDTGEVADAFTEFVYLKSPETKYVIRARGTRTDQYRITVHKVSDGKIVSTQNFVGATRAGKIISHTLRRDVPNLPVITVSTAKPKAYESKLSPGRIKISRSGDSSLTTTVHYSITGSAVAGLQYQALSGEATIQPGTTFTTIDVIPLQDTLPKQNTTVFFSLTDDNAYTLNKHFQAAVTIVGK